MYALPPCALSLASTSYRPCSVLYDGAHAQPRAGDERAHAVTSRFASCIAGDAPSLTFIKAAGREPMPASSRLKSDTMIHPSLDG
jgi:hypothetical protein